MATQSMNQASSGGYHQRSLVLTRSPWDLVWTSLIEAEMEASGPQDSSRVDFLAVAWAVAWVGLVQAKVLKCKHPPARSLKKGGDCDLQKGETSRQNRPPARFQDIQQSSRRNSQTHCPQT